MAPMTPSDWHCPRARATSSTATGSCICSSPSMYPTVPHSTPSTSSGSILVSPTSPPIPTGTSTPGRMSAHPKEAQPPAKEAPAEEHKGSKKRFRRMRDKEARFRRHRNHCISKRLVETAKRTDRGIALEDLEGIRERVTARGGEARNRLSGWASRNSARSSATRPGSRASRWSTWIPGTPAGPVPSAAIARRATASQGGFLCKGCGHQDHADRNAARNIRCRALGASKPPIGLGNHPIRRVV